MKNPLTPQVQRVVLTLMEGLDCPRSLQVAILVRYEEWDQLTLLRVDPKHYCDSEAYLDAAAATEFLRKFDGFPLSLDLKAQAVEKWYWAEKQCFRTNQRFNEIMDFGTLGGKPVHERVWEFLLNVKKHVVELIGSGPDPENIGYFGPGATVSDDARRATIPHKMSSVPTLTSSALYYLVPWTGTKWAAACAARGDVAKIVRSDKFFTVPKHSRALRGCAKGPSVNTFYQLGLGRDMRRRLKVRGIDLEEGQMVHRRVACAGSKTGDICTIDLTSASDLNATAFVRFALPPRWFEATDDLRTSFTEIDGRVVKLEKFSAMGNGFTFELETTMFLAVCLAAMEGAGKPGKNVWVYGDDIIVPTEFYGVVIAALKFCGFVPNPEKCFGEGNFRESCGGDYFDGVAVRPFYLKGVVDQNQPQQIIAMANGIRRLALTNGQNPQERWSRLRRAWFACLDMLSPDVRKCRGPEYFGDLVIHDDEERWSIRWRNHGNIRWIRVYRPAKFLGTSWSRFDGEVQFAAVLYGVKLHRRYRRTGDQVRLMGESVLGRDAVAAYKVGWMPYS